MIKSILILAIAVVTSSMCFGQNNSKDFEVSTGEPYKVVDAENKQYFQVDNGNVLSLKTDRERIYVQLFDGESANEIKRNEYDDQLGGSILQRVIQTSEGMFYFFQVYDRKSRSFDLYMRQVDTENATLGKPKKIMGTTRKITKGVTNEDGRYPLSMGTAKMDGLTGMVNAGANFSVHQSYDKSKILIQYRLTPEQKRDALNYDELGFYVFDAQVNKVWGDEYKMPHTEAEMNNLAYAVSDDGTVYMISYLVKDKALELITIDGEGGLDTHLLPGVDAELKFNRIHLIEDASGGVRCAMYYANAYDFKGSVGFGTFSATAAFMASGIYGFTISKDFEVSNIYSVEFPLDMVKEYLSERQSEEMQKREEEGTFGIEDLTMEEFYSQEDGSFIVVGEQKYIRNEFYITGSQNVAHFSNMVITKVSADGEVIWIQKLPKNQAAPMGDKTNYFFEGQLSYNYIAANNQHYFLFVDNPKNESLSDNQVPEAHKNGMGGFLTAFKVDDKTGEYVRMTLTDLKDVKGYTAHQFAVTRIAAAGDNVFLMEIYKKGKEDVMIRLEIEE